MAKSSAFAFFCGSIAFFLGGSPALSAAETNTLVRPIGVEGRLSLELPSPDYRLRPLDDRTDLILRIEATTAVKANWYRYELYYTGFESGSYSLADISPGLTVPGLLNLTASSSRSMGCCPKAMMASSPATP